VFASFHRQGAGLVVALLCATMIPQDKLAEYQSKFAKESNPVHKAKLMRPLGDAEFDEITAQVGAGNLSGALVILKRYRDEAQICEKKLNALGVNPEKHSEGFKQLQISLRESLRRLDVLIVDLARDEQQPFLEVRKDLDAIDRRLIQQLFPRGPGDTQPAGKPTS
jgi:hypothetical protein